jgi:superfamily II DNA or RNA helicase
MEHLGDYFKFVIFDECHHLPGDLRGDAARFCAAPYRLGLTAAPRRSDGREDEYEDLIGPICHQTDIGDLRGTVLAPYKIQRIPVYLTDAEQAHYEDLFRLHMQQIVVFTATNRMVRTIALRFLIPCILSHTKKKERKVILDGLESGAFRAVIANRVLNEGIDVRPAKIGIVIGGTGSERESVQRLGRILRKKGVQKATLYEVVCAGTGEEERSRKRRRNDAYQC